MAKKKQKPFRARLTNLADSGSYKVYESQEIKLRNGWKRVYRVYGEYVGHGWIQSSPWDYRMEALSFRGERYLEHCGRENFKDLGYAGSTLVDVRNMIESDMYGKKVIK